MGTLAATALLLALAAPDDRALSLFRSVVERNPSVEDRLSCDYTTVARIEGRLVEERFTADGGWRLVAVNDAAPSLEALDQYERGASERRRRGHPTELDLATTARPDTVALATEDYESLTFTFALAPAQDGEDPPFLDKLQGTLTVSKSGFVPTRFVIETLEEVSPAPTVKLRQFRQETTLVRDARLGALLVEEMRVLIRGKAFLFRTLDEDRHIRFTDYDCAPLSALPSRGSLSS